MPANSEPAAAPTITTDHVIKPMHTHAEILQQPKLWSDTLDRVRVAAAKSNLPTGSDGRGVLLTGAGTSAYCAAAVAAAWPHAIAVPSTDLLVDPERSLSSIDVVISLARSGNSPESAAVVRQIRQLRSGIRHLAITCNEQSDLTTSGLDDLILLDPRTNDRSLVMTSSFSNLVLAGLCLAQPAPVAATVPIASARAATLLPAIERVCGAAAALVRDRIVILSSSPLQGWAREAGLKTVEMTAGKFPVLTETYLGLRHGPMSFVREDTLVLCLLSSDPHYRLYEADLLRELRSKKLGYLLGIAPADQGDLFDAVVPAVLPDARDEFRTPYEIATAQLLGYHLSLRAGLNPDNPSPDGVIHRVVEGVTIYPLSPDPDSRAI